MKSESSASNELVWDRRARFALWLMEHTKEPVFITGRAGTGKSTLLQYFRKSTAKRIAILAPTGLAAINVNGQTIHSFFRLPSRMITDDAIKRIWGNQVIRKIDTLVIDEVSMVRADLMDGIHKALQINRKNDLLFGGVQVVFFGDLFQLPPVVSRAEESLMQAHYSSPYFFSAKVFQEVKPIQIELTTVHRQKEEAFLELLNQVREDRLSEWGLGRLNERVIIKKPPDDYLVLTTVNDKARRINEERLKSLGGPPFTYVAHTDGDFNERDFPTESELTLKVGARVMFLRNDPDGLFVNGTLGTVEYLHGEIIRIETDDGDQVEVSPEKWENMRYYFDAEENKIVSETVGTFTQYPLKLAYAITIHKSQGQTFDKVAIDLDRGAFTHGQTYVALSRCRTFEGILLTRPIRSSDVLFDPIVYEATHAFQPGNQIYQDYLERFKEAKNQLLQGNSAYLVSNRLRLPLATVQKMASELPTSI
ncbi:MAG TPA: AAA family ATPase [Rhodothermales bacterium]|nr:AAA family ATPase [Rhodothermales bacterium]